MTQRVQPGILGAAVRGDDSSSDLRRLPHADDHWQGDGPAVVSGEHEIGFASRGQASRHSRKAFTTIGSSGTERRLEADLSGRSR